jgi:hypothetical protein
MKNQFEHSARAAKVARLLALVPAAHTPDQVHATAVYCASMTHAQRYELARQAGVLWPSDETWARLVSAIWARGVTAERRSA